MLLAPYPEHPAAYYKSEMQKALSAIKNEACLITVVQLFAYTFLPEMKPAIVASGVYQQTMLDTITAFPGQRGLAAFLECSRLWPKKRIRICTVPIQLFLTKRMFPSTLLSTCIKGFIRVETRCGTTQSPSSRRTTLIPSTSNCSTKYGQPDKTCSTKLPGNSAGKRRCSPELLHAVVRAAFGLPDAAKRIPANTNDCSE